MARNPSIPRLSPKEALAALRLRAERYFELAETVADPEFQAKARARGYAWLKRADEAERAEAAKTLPADLAAMWNGRMSPLRNAALLQLARVEANIAALEAEAPPLRSARANILAALRRKKAELEEVCGI
ncbi:MAG: hypothetical protein IRZ04_15540 [Rhodospirillales bacterium]|nr:hypothetical protein [Rhodospirillales bacterium]